MKNVISCLYSDYLRYTDQFRAIPWLIDLLKPVEKRLLLTVHQEARNRPVKSAKVVGSCMGTYHPHGDASIYGSLVSLVQRGYVEGIGNFGGQGLTDSSAGAMRYTECKANKFLDDGFSEFLDFVPWEQLELEKEPLYLPFYIPIGLIGEGIISGIGLHTTKIPRYAFNDLLKRLHELVTGSPSKTTIVPNILNCDIFEDAPGVSFESILTTGEGVVQCVPRIRLDKDGLHILGQNPITKFNSLVKFNLDHETKNGAEYCTIIDLSSKTLDVLITPKKGPMTNKFIMSIMELISTKIHVKCNVIDSAGTVILKSIDDLLLNSFGYWKKAYYDKLNDDLSKAIARLEELNIIVVIRDILEKNPAVKSIADICKLNTSKYTTDQISYVAGKHRIKTLIETQVDLQAAQRSITVIQNDINNIHQISLKRIQNLLGI
jgi:hypothetical protein